MSKYTKRKNSFRKKNKNAKTKRKKNGGKNRKKTNKQFRGGSALSMLNSKPPGPMLNTKVPGKPMLNTKVPGPMLNSKPPGPMLNTKVPGIKEENITVKNLTFKISENGSNNDTDETILEPMTDNKIELSVPINLKVLSNSLDCLRGNKQIELEELILCGGYNCIFKLKNLNMKDKLVIRISKISPFSNEKNKKIVDKNKNQIKLISETFQDSKHLSISLCYGDLIHHINNFTSSIFSIEKYYPIDLFDFIDKKNQISFQEKIKIIKGICLGIQELSAKKYLHRDLKPENILMDNENNSFLIDFDMIIKINDRNDNSIVGTTKYIDPWYKQTKQLNLKSDIWSLGVIIFDIIGFIIPSLESNGDKNNSFFKNISQKDEEYRSHIKKSIDSSELDEKTKKFTDKIFLGGDNHKGIFVWDIKQRISLEQIIKIIDENQTN